MPSPSQPSLPPLPPTLAASTTAPQQLALAGVFTYTVSEVTALLQRSMEEHPTLSQKLVVQGEVSNLKRSSRGHVYFTLKDEGAALSCTLWASAAAKLKHTLEEGQALYATGKLGLYAPNGTYALSVQSVEPVGLGALQQAYQQLKEQLETEGLFDPQRKRPLPTFPTRIGIITSPTGAVLQDMVRVIQAKNPRLHVVFAPASVQGQGAAASIAQAIEALQHPSLALEALIVARGGGSFEDLFCFSEAPVVRAIANSRLPIVTGIGHEPDFGLADAAADYSAQTPTAAADTLVPHWGDWQAGIAAQANWLKEAWQRRLNQEEQQLEQRSEALAERLQWRLQQAAERLAQRTQALQEGMTSQLQQAQHTLAQQRTALDAYSPTALLKKGFSLLSHPATGQPLYTVATVQQAMGQQTPVRLTLSDGALTVVLSEG
jgi:exodeoxyribonuclease VII large subunit